MISFSCTRCMLKYLLHMETWSQRKRCLDGTLDVNPTCSTNGVIFDKDSSL
ncbi:hypothetical protein LguiA_034661 [Lonicera macranthoides]